MKPTLRSLCGILAATLLSGCFQVETVVSVKPDGSGTVTESVMMPKSMLEQMKQMTEGFAKGLGEAAKAADPNAKVPADATASASKGFDLMDEKKLKEQASKMGSGVTFVSAKKVTNDKGEGYVATYAFTDINQLRIDQSPSDNMPDAGPMGGPGGSGGDEAKREEKSEPITFQFKKGKVAELIVKNPSPQTDPAAKSSEKKPEDSAPGGEEMAMMVMQQMFKDMRMSLKLEIADGIAETNASHVEGNVVTLIDMPFGKLLADPANMKKLEAMKDASPADAAAAFKDIAGLKIETKEEVTVKVK